MMSGDLTASYQLTKFMATRIEPSDAARKTAYSVIQSWSWLRFGFHSGDRGEAGSEVDVLMCLLSGTGETGVRKVIPINFHAEERAVVVRIRSSVSGENDAGPGC